jgi:PhoH-like ATPase
MLRGQGDLRKGVEYYGTTVRIEINHIDATDLPMTVKQDKTTDIRILAVALHLKGVLVTKDLPLRLLASVCGVDAMDAPTTVEVDDSVDDLPVIHVNDDVIEELYEHGKAKVDLGKDHELPVNAAAIFKSHSESSSALVVQGKGWSVRLVGDRPVQGVSGRSAEQRVAIDYLTHEDIPIVSLGGTAGTGKTVLALAAGVEQVLDSERPYEKIIVFRTLHAVGGQELGYLPGTEEEKMSPWVAAVYDALEGFLPKSKIEKLKREHKIEVLPLTHIRGRTLNNAFVIVDEAQNLERSVLLTALTRIGRGSKIVLTHDIAQRDNLRVGRHDGIYEVVQRLRGEKLFAHVALKKSERSAVSELVARVLDDGVS